MHSVYHMDIHASVLGSWAKVSIHRFLQIHVEFPHTLLEDWTCLKKLFLCTATLRNIREEVIEGILHFLSKSLHEGIIHIPLHDESKDIMDSDTSIIIFASDETHQ